MLSIRNIYQRICRNNLPNKGGFILDLADNTFKIKNTIFEYNCAFEGGAILNLGSSDI